MLVSHSPQNRTMTKTVILLLLFTGIAAFILHKVDVKTTIKSGKLIGRGEPRTERAADSEKRMLLLKAKAAKTFAGKKGFNESVCFLISFSAKSPHTLH